MATWMSHFRVAELVSQNINIRDLPAFAVGNIGPDCGVPNTDWSKFDPPKEISHFHDPITNRINPEKFYSDFCTVQSEKSDFYLGYYIHLLCDIYWSEIIWAKKKVKYAEELKQNPKFVWMMKKDWYDLDRCFIRDKQLRVFDSFKSIQNFPNNYFTFYPQEAFSNQIKYISDFYEKFPDDLQREYVYLTEDELGDYVEESAKRVLGVLKSL